MCVQLAMSQRRKSITGIVTPALSWLSLLSDTDPSCHWCVKMGDESRCQVQQSHIQQLRQSIAVQHAHEEGLGLGLGLDLQLQLVIRCTEHMHAAPASMM